MEITNTTSPIWVDYIEARDQKTEKERKQKYGRLLCKYASALDIDSQHVKALAMTRMGMDYEAIQVWKSILNSRLACNAHYHLGICLKHMRQLHPAYYHFRKSEMMGHTKAGEELIEVDSEIARKDGVRETGRV